MADTLQSRLVPTPSNTLKTGDQANAPVSGNGAVVVDQNKHEGNK